MPEGITISPQPSEVGSISVGNVVRKFIGKTSAPTVNDDITSGYIVSDLWIDETNDESYQCLDNSDGAAVWTRITGAADAHAASHKDGGSDDLLSAPGAIGGTTPATGTFTTLTVEGDEGELITNGGFDSDTTGWTATNNALLASIAGGKSGNCLRITENGGASPQARQTIAVTAGETYTFQGYVKAGTEATYRVILFDVDNSVAIWNTGNLEETAGDWSTVIETSFVVPTGCTQIYILIMQVCSISVGTTLLFDSITLKLESVLRLGEATTPVAIADYGAVYPKSDNLLYFQDGAGVEHTLAMAGANADITSMTGLTQITRATGGAFDIAIGGAAGDDFTVDTDKLVVEGDTGRIGIGTTTPGAKLEVFGGEIWMFEDGGSPRFVIGDTVAAGNYGYMQWNSANDYLDIRVQGAGTQLIVASGGNVGIGTASPSTLLHIAGSGASVIRLSDIGASTDRQVNAFTEYYRGVATNRVGWAGFGSSSNDDYTIKNQITGGDIILAPTAGNVGIVTPTPLELLHVGDGGGTDYGLFQTRSIVADRGGVLLSNDPGTTAGYTSLKMTSTFNSGTSARARIGFVANSNKEVFLNSGAAIEFQYDGDIILAQGTGKVGIGTSSPSEKLDVNSDAIRIRTAQTPASAGAAGTAGQICWDADYVYVCVATNTWKRTAISTW